MRLRRKIILVVAAAVLLVPTALVYYVATTESGLQFIARHLGKIGPVTLTVKDVRGTLVRGFSVGSLHIQHRRADIRIEQASGHVALLPLLTLQRIQLPDVHVGHVTIAVFHDPEEQHGEPRFLPATMRVDARNVTVDRAELTAINGYQMAATHVKADVTILPKQIRIRTAQLDYQQTHLQGTGRVFAAHPFGLRGDVDVRYNPDDLPEWRVGAHVDGDLDKLPFDAHITQPFHAEVKGSALALTSRWHFEGRAQIQDFDLVPFGGGDALGIISGQLDLTANNDGFTARGSLTPPGLKAGAMAVTFDGAYSNKHLEIRHATATHASSGAHGSVHGGVDIISGGPRLTLAGEWTNFRWPLAGLQPAFSSARGSYRLSGVKPWHVEADGLASAAGYNDMPGTLQGALAADSLQIDGATLGILGSNTSFRGEVRWKPAESWHLTGHVENLDPTLLRPDLPGRLAFDFDVTGAPFGADAAIDFDLRHLTGRLRGQAASGGGHFARAVRSEDWQFRNVDLHFGRTHIALDGGLGAHRDLAFVLEAEDLSLLDPAAMGRVTARGRLAGTDAAPVLLFKARGTDFAWHDRKLAALNADVDIDLGASRRTEGEIDLDGLQIGSRTVQKMNVQLTGSADAQHIVARVEATPLRSALIAQGVVNQGQWRGQITSLAIDDADKLQLKLEAPAALQFDTRQFHVDELCVMGSEARLCASGTGQSDGNWKATFSTSALPLRTLTAGLSQDVDYEGTINLNADVAGVPGSLPTGNLSAQLQQAQLRHRLGNGRDERMSLGNGSVTANATPDAFSLRVGLDAGDAGNIRGQLDGQRNTGDWHDYPIAGSLDASTTSLGVLDVYVGDIDKATGRLNTRVQIGGTLGAPTIRGTLQLRDAQIDVYQVNLSLRALTLDASLDADTLHLAGQTRIGEGSANFSGELAWRDREPFGSLHLEGENLRVVDVPEARIEASPKLDFKLDGRRIAATGEVQVPYGRLEPADLTNAVLTSSDEVIVGAAPVSPEQRWIVTSDIKLALGDNVNIKSLGLDAKLGGAITVLTDEAQISRGKGELNIKSGKYAAFGRLLDIDHGRLLFNGPLNDPGVDLRAQKTFPSFQGGDTTAGVNVRGPLRNPQLTFFSDPGMPQSQIASLILAGGSFDSAQNSQRPGAARNEMLAQGGAILAQQIGSRVGIQDVSIESSFTGDPTDAIGANNATGTSSSDTSLVLGRYLSPRLYISYGISLAEAINTLKLRYTIGDHWTLKTEAGKARSADIVFTVQKGKKKKAAEK